MFENLNSYQIVILSAAGVTVGLGIFIRYVSNWVKPASRIGKHLPNQSSNIPAIKLSDEDREILRKLSMSIDRIPMAMSEMREPMHKLARELEFISRSKRN